jgi:hypothetical protein
MQNFTWKLYVVKESGINVKVTFIQIFDISKRLMWIVFFISIWVIKQNRFRCEKETQFVKRLNFTIEARGVVLHQPRDGDNAEWNSRFFGVEASTSTPITYSLMKLRIDTAIYISHILLLKNVRWATKLSSWWNNRFFSVPLHRGEKRSLSLVKLETSDKIPSHSRQLG